MEIRLASYEENECNIHESLTVCAGPMEDMVGPKDGTQGSGFRDPGNPNVLPMVRSEWLSVR